MTNLLKGFLAAAVLAAPVAANATLISTDGGLGVYDTTNNVTWTSNANLFATQAASYPGGQAAFVAAVIAASGGVIHDTPNVNDPSGTYTLSASDFNLAGAGTMDWWGAQAWVNYLNVTNYGGSNQWALPTTVNASSSTGYPNGGSGNPAQSSSQMALLFYGNLGQIAGSAITTSHNGAYALFSNVQTDYMSGTEYSNPNGTWFYHTYVGYQDFNGKRTFSYALAVSPGQVGQSVPNNGNNSDGPIPIWALGVLGAGIVGIARRRLKFAA